MTAQCLVVVDTAALADLVENDSPVLFAVCRGEIRDWLTYHLLRGVSKGTFGTFIPAGDGAVEIITHNGVVGGFDDGSEESRGFRGPFFEGFFTSETNFIRRFHDPGKLP